MKQFVSSPAFLTSHFEVLNTQLKNSNKPKSSRKREIIFENSLERYGYEMEQFTGIIIIIQISFSKLLYYSLHKTNQNIFWVWKLFVA